MAKVHTHKARKDYPNDGIQKGQQYYKWTLRPGGPGSKGVTYRSPTYPKPWQLTSSDFLQRAYQIEYNIQNYEGEPDGLQDIVSDLEELREETQEKLDNMPESLQYSPTGELLQERIDALENCISELEQLSGEELEEETIEDDIKRDDWLDEVCGIDLGL